MKKLIGLFLVIALLTFSCEKDNSFEQMIGTYECTLYVKYVNTDKYVVLISTSNPYTIVNPPVQYYERCIKGRTLENGDMVYEKWIKTGK